MQLITVHGVRGYIDKNGTAQLNLEDVSRGLGFIQRKGNAEYVRRDRVNGYLTDMGFPQLVGKEFIPENVFYRLAMKGETETALIFQSKVADEILPSIRQHGAYMTPATIEQTLSNPDFIIGLATRLKAANEEKARLAHQIEQDRRYTDFGKVVSNSNAAINVGAFAKMIFEKHGISLGRNKLFEWMRDRGYLIKTGREKNNPKQTYIQQGWFEVRPTIVSRTVGDVESMTTLITGKGQVRLVEILLQEFKSDTRSIG